jgi:hypothetical protein
MKNLNAFTKGIKVFFAQDTLLGKTEGNPEITEIYKRTKVRVPEAHRASSS